MGGSLSAGDGRAGIAHPYRIGGHCFSDLDSQTEGF